MLLKTRNIKRNAIPLSDLWFLSLHHTRKSATSLNDAVDNAALSAWSFDPRISSSTDHVDRNVALVYWTCSWSDLGVDWENQRADFLMSGANRPAARTFDLLIMLRHVRVNMTRCGDQALVSLFAFHCDWPEFPSLISFVMNITSDQVIFSAAESCQTSSSLQSWTVGQRRKQKQVFQVKLLEAVFMLFAESCNVWLRFWSQYAEMTRAKLNNSYWPADRISLITSVSSTCRRLQQTRFPRGGRTRDIRFRMRTTRTSPRNQQRISSESLFNHWSVEAGWWSDVWRSRPPCCWVVRSIARLCFILFLRLWQGCPFEWGYRCSPYWIQADYRWC